MINNPGNEKIVEKASEELSLRTSSSIKSETDLFNILHNLFGAIKGKMVMPKPCIHNAKRGLNIIPKASLREKLKVDKSKIAEIYLIEREITSEQHKQTISPSCHRFLTLLEQQVSVRNSTANL